MAKPAVRKDTALFPFRLKDGLIVTTWKVSLKFGDPKFYDITFNNYPNLFEYFSSTSL